MYNRQADILSHYRALQDQIRGDILRESEEQIIGTDTEELVKYYYENNILFPIEEDPEREITWDIQDYLETISAYQRERGYGQEGDLHNFQCQKVVVEVPIIYNKNLREIANLRSSTYAMSYSDQDFYWGDDKISIIVKTKGYGFEYDQNKIAQEVQQAIKKIKDSIGWKNSDIKRGNIELMSYITNVMNERKQKIVQNKEKIAALTKMINIPLKQKQSASSTLVRIAHTPLVQRVKPKPTLPEEYIIDEARINDVVTLLDNQARNYENSPRAVKELGEEDLRDLLLANINSVFVGSATGETFSKKGKTDIYLVINKGNILISECKIWGGQSLYNETIDQLRGYLTWRHNFGIMIIFVRLKDFTKALRESELAIKAHNSYISGFNKISDTHYISNHKVDDDEKTVKIHHLFYHIYI